MTLNEVLKNTNYDVSLFSEEARKYVEDSTKSLIHWMKNGKSFSKMHT